MIASGCRPGFRWRRSCRGSVLRAGRSVRCRSRPGAHPARVHAGDAGPPRRARDHRQISTGWPRPRRHRARGTCLTLPRGQHRRHRGCPRSTRRIRSSHRQSRCRCGLAGFARCHCAGSRGMPVAFLRRRRPALPRPAIQAQAQRRPWPRVQWWPAQARQRRERPQEAQDEFG